MPRFEFQLEKAPTIDGDDAKPFLVGLTRAPHCWIADSRSTLDLFGGGFVVVRFGSPDANVEPLMAAASERGVPVEVIDLDHADAAAIYEKPFVLVRPDGHVAWRGDALPEDAAALIDHVRGA